ncbi:MAG: 2TM domain-containing protein, partial [Phaeodactylibacter sp.]|nr:2TM domain-containing protein [Phaeodactylibacter sp.]
MFNYKYHAGRRRFRGKKGFYRRLVFYMILAIFLMVVNLFTFSGTLWFPWALMGLGI